MLFRSLARACLTLQPPLICAIGHENNVLLCEEIADYRAKTPSSAVEVAVPWKSKLITHNNQLLQNMINISSCFLLKLAVPKIPSNLNQYQSYVNKLRLRLHADVPCKLVLKKTSLLRSQTLEKYKRTLNEIIKNLSKIHSARMVFFMNKTKLKLTTFKHFNLQYYKEKLSCAICTSRIHDAHVKLLTTSTVTHFHNIIIDKLVAVSCSSFGSIEDFYPGKEITLFYKRGKVKLITQYVEK